MSVVVDVDDRVLTVVLVVGEDLLAGVVGAVGTPQCQQEEEQTDGPPHHCAFLTIISMNIHIRDHCHWLRPLTAACSMALNASPLC